MSYTEPTLNEHQLGQVINSLERIAMLLEKQSEILNGIYVKLEDNSPEREGAWIPETSLQS